MKIGSLEVYGVIYKITNLVNGKVYIGQTKNGRGFKDRYCCDGEGIERVYKYHLSAKENGRTTNTYLLNSIKKYGFEKFKVIECFDYAFSLNELNIKEELWIKYYNSTNRKYGYNFRKGGDNYKFAEDSYVYRGKEIICINTNIIYKSLAEASRIYNMGGKQISNTFKEKRNINNVDEYLFRETKDKDYLKDYKRCIYCGKLFKIHKNQNNSVTYCNSCRKNGNKIPKIMKKIPKESNFKPKIKKDISVKEIIKFIVLNNLRSISCRELKNKIDNDKQIYCTIKKIKQAYKDIYLKNL